MKQTGFTLAELLIALAILGVIAVFTIPKVLQGQTDSRNNSIVKETISSISAAYQQYSLTNTPSSTTGMSDLTPYLNFIKVDTTSTADFIPCAGTFSCAGGGYNCFTLHNGANLMFPTGMAFGGTGVTNALRFQLDPDGKVTNGTGDAGKGVAGYIYFNGSVRTRKDILPNTTNTNSTDTPNSACEPTWFHWD